ncbi:MAG TPA: TlpA disulfide reductase family protein [Candidatus Deferrimicrobiaceae bacterium]|nr:TlpA disulfide reductase family protein [Candidatus Deferrimicrobiaceae bacterium]
MRPREPKPRGPGGLRPIAWALAATLALAGPALPQPPRSIDAVRLNRYAPDTKPPGFRGRTVAGHLVSLAEIRGRVVLLNFWATWCLECRQEMPALERLHRELTPQGLTVMGVNVREDVTVVRDYARELGLTFTLVLDLNGDISKAYGVIGIPTTFLIGRDGRAVALAIGPRAWDGAPAREILRVLLAESAPPPGTP